MESGFSFQKIGVVRRNRLGDMVCTLPLIHALRDRFPQAKIAVWSDAAGCELASLCSAVNEAHRIRTSRLKLLTPWLNQRKLQECDLVIGVKGGFDRMLARIVEKSDATMRIGFDLEPRSFFYTHPIFPPETYEHQIKTLFRLLEPLGISEPSSYRFDLGKLNPAPLLQNKILFCLDCNRGQYWGTERYLELMDRLQQAHQIQSVVLQRPDAPFEKKWIDAFSTRSVEVVTTKTLRDLGNLLQSVRGFITPEGGLAHFAACTQTPTVVLWKKDGVIRKWGSTATTHYDLQPAEGFENWNVEQMQEVILRHLLKIA